MHLICPRPGAAGRVCRVEGFGRGLDLKGLCYLRHMQLDFRSLCYCGVRSIEVSKYQRVSVSVSVRICALGVSHLWKCLNASA
jgi:hypothetical protein